MIALVGLGNPELSYHDNRHNVGFLVIDAIANDLNFPKFQQKAKFHISQGSIENNKVLLIKPKTFMNLSGEAILALSSFYKISPQDIIVIHDELDLPLGKIKIKIGGGSSGHNGLKSIINHIGSDFIRLRFGIDRPEHKNMVSNYVLSDFPSDQMLIVKDKITQILSLMPQLINKNFAQFNSQIGSN